MGWAAVEVAGCKRAAAGGLEEAWAVSLVEGCRAAGRVAEGLAVRCYRRVATATTEAAGKIARADAEGQDDLA